MKNIKQSKPIDNRKKDIRLDIKKQKQLLSSDELHEKSSEIISVVELLGVFQDAKNIFIYHAMPDEVQTLALIQKWLPHKRFFTPVIQDTNLTFRQYTNNTVFTKSQFGILEPNGEDFTDYNLIDLVIVPGVAFDRKKNRLGYGKGFYDRFLPSIKAPKMGICFDFQLIDSVPTDKYDVAMNYIVSENDIIW